MLRKFIRANQRLADRLEAKLPHIKPNVGALFEERVVAEMNRRPNLQVADIGSGRRTPFADYRDAAMRPHLTGVDISEAELRQNRDLDDYRVADAAQGLPFDDAVADLITSLNTLEHIYPMPALVKEVYRVLKPGGLFIAMFSSRYAPFAIVNRLLPHALSKRLLYSLYPESRDGSGFVAYYDRCTAAGMEALLRAEGFEVERSRVSYYQSAYYRFFVPFYLLSAGYELLIRALGLRALAARVMVVARKPEVKENSR